jgi:hypothetical protein
MDTCRSRRLTVGRMKRYGFYFVDPRLVSIEFRGRRCGGMRQPWEGPTPANGTGQLVRCGHCTSSGSVQCMSCSGTGHLNY